MNDVQIENAKIEPNPLIPYIKDSESEYSDYEYLYIGDSYIVFKFMNYGDSRPSEWKIHKYNSMVNDLPKGTFYMSENYNGILYHFTVIHNNYVYLKIQSEYYKLVFNISTGNLVYSVHNKNNPIINGQFSSDILEKLKTPGFLPDDPEFD